ncbi:hypothetical protein EHI8A_223460 [Entamoeba histolytica HM-1:IMSS-B]|nr:Hypothetical protein EHI5A_221990 [Entamoeba histolytica KU27]EMH77937.1 hypothetical protein EHI8A_223460 [Entamoeba histolytica HM-1:IMSS-B]ENY60887.1 hypothetical protein EHI7A_191790 [Entamoeba histolytica HM-1:IMSS-A]GAT93580.1 vesicle transport protein sft2b [Entamoeba histolytica]
MECGCRCCLWVILAIILPPLAVGLLGGCTTHFWINIILCLICWFPAQVHAVWYVASF